MAKVIYWSCPYCNRDATLQDQDRDIGQKNFTIQKPAEGHNILEWSYVVCPNPQCRKYTLQVRLFKGYWSPPKITRGNLIQTWDLVPSSKAKVFPVYVLKPILDDYNEACLIVNLSPKASATLSRRCLQGILRDYCKVKPGNLADEIEQIKDKTDPVTWDAIDSVRKVGNIGAHMENDINIIVDVDPKEAKLLIGLIEMLIKEWYVASEERRNQLIEIKSIATQKDEDKNQGNGQPEN